MSSRLVPVILSGGAGTRLWPISRRETPKQLIDLLGDRSLLQQTAQRAARLTDESPIVVCSQSHADEVALQMDSIEIPHRLILEPVGRNTAPAVAVAALAAGRDSLLLVLPSDHTIADIEAFSRAVHIARNHANAGSLVTFGIAPWKPETGFGYIRKGEDFGDAHRIEQFVEKPDANTATFYVDSGEYLWNSGMFMFRADAYLGALDEHAPEMAAAVSEVATQSRVENDRLLLDEHSFAACPSDSIDYAVMEHSERGVVVPLNAGWSDVGSWAAMWELNEKDHSGNSVQGDVLVDNVNDSLIRSESRLVAVAGLSGIIVVETADSVLVVSRDETQRVGRLVEMLDQHDRSETAKPPNRI